MKYIIEINEDNDNSFYSEEFDTLEKAIAMFWEDTLAYVDVYPGDVFVYEVVE